MSSNHSPSLLLLLLSGLAACSSANADKDFLCEAQAGSPCTTIAAVDGTDGANVTTVTERPEDRLADQLSQGLLGRGKGPVAMQDGGTPYVASAYRVPEQVGTLWIAPFLDQDGLLHESRFVHFVVAEATWKAQ